MLYGAGAINIASPTGQEQVSVDNGGSVGVYLTAQQIANLAGQSAQIVNTAISTTGATGTLTAAAIVSRLITRTGPTQNFTDTTVTAAAIIAALTNPTIGQSFNVDIVNASAYAETIVGGLGVTVSGISVIPAGMTGRYLFTYTAASTVTAYGTLLASSAGTITDAIYNGVTYCSASASIASTTTVVNVTGLSVNVTGGGTYVLRAHLTGTANAAAGLKVAMTGTAAMSSSTVTGWSWNGSTINTGATQTTWGSNVIANTAAYTDAILEGAFVCQTSGTVTLAAAQNASQTTATVVQTGSSMTIFRQS